MLERSATRSAKIGRSESAIETVVMTLNEESSNIMEVFSPRNFTDGAFDLRSGLAIYLRMGLELE